MISVAAVTSGFLVPSARYRVRQYIEPLLRGGVGVTEYVPAIDKYAPLPGWPNNVPQRYALGLYLGWQCCKVVARVPAVVRSHWHDITWLQRELLSGLVTLEPLLQKPIVFDVDDAIWEVSSVARLAVPVLARQSAVVVAGNAYLADYLSRWSPRVEIVNTAVDTALFRPAEPDATAERRARGECVLGWTGSSSTLQYLEAIEGPIRRVMERHRGVGLLVVADRPPRFRELDTGRVRFEPWSPSNEAALVREMDIGLMPLPDSSWTRGKCSFKMIQYMASGLPCVVSPVGMNAEILASEQLGLAATTDPEWESALECLISHPELRGDMGAVGRRVAQTRFDARGTAARLAEIFRSVASAN